MLTHLLVCDFTLVERQEITFERGLTVLTGETGAGKSLLLEALSFVLGSRADVNKVRQGAEQAEVCASFDLTHLTKARNWLQEADLNGEECIIRRILHRDGRSRAQINGRPVTQTQVRALAALLVDIHSQHAHQALLMSSAQRKLLDAFGQHGPAVREVTHTFKALQACQQQLEALKNQSDELNARLQLLTYQAEELDTLNLKPGELDELEGQQKQLVHFEQTQHTCLQVIDTCVTAEEAIATQLHRLTTQLKNLPHPSNAVEVARSLLNEAKIQVEEAARELERDTEEALDESALAEVEERLSAIYEVARKHRVAPEALVDLHTQVSEELQSLMGGDHTLEALEAQCDKALDAYQTAANQLSSLRNQTAKRLAKQVNQHLKSLAMANAELSVTLQRSEQPTAYGGESVDFLISTVPGQPPLPLNKIVSGGELSRISLAIQMVTAKTAVTPTLIFDEVDVGIGGATGDVVGRLLRALSDNTQVLCVTHLAQVASKAHHHYTVEKVTRKKSVLTILHQLDEEGKIMEVARMMGGAIDSEQSLAHAREMLEGR